MTNLNYQEKLEDIARFIEEKAHSEGYKGIECLVKEVYIDLGQGIKEETLVLTDNGDPLFQMLSQRDISEIKEGLFNKDEFYSKYSNSLEKYGVKRSS